MHRNERARLRLAPSSLRRRADCGPNGLETASPTQGSAPAPVGGARTAKVKKRILVIDDEVDFSQLLKLSLEQTGDFQVRVANTCREGLAAAEESAPDLILLDVMLPDMDGGEVAARLRAHPKWCQVPIIFLTAAVRRAEVSSRNGRIGGLPFIAKPVDLPELINCLNRHLSGTSAA
jgi:two-component system OmpR family response regulator